MLDVLDTGQLLIVAYCRLKVVIQHQADQGQAARVVKGNVDARRASDWIDDQSNGLEWRGLL